MYTLRLSAAAEGVIIDRESGAVSIYSLLDRLTAEGFPVLIQKVSFLTIWQRGPEDAAQIQGRFSVRLGDRDIYVHPEPTQIDFRDAPRNQTVLTIWGLAIPAPGTLVFRMALVGVDVIAEYTVDVVAGANAMRAAVAQPPVVPNPLPPAG